MMLNRLAALAGFAASAFSSLGAAASRVVDRVDRWSEDPGVFWRASRTRLTKGPLSKRVARNRRRDRLAKISRRKNRRK